jgi:hypothetical protein
MIQVEVFAYYDLFFPYSERSPTEGTIMLEEYLKHKKGFLYKIRIWT